jgi:N-methylhydantoinase A/acetophenone carboxylase
MGFTIDIDTGGTFTDGFLSRGGDVRTVKVPTTPHDLTVCFWECIKAGAAAFGVDEEELLYNTEIIRFSNTIGTNTIIERDGTRIGLLLGEGQRSLAPTAQQEGRPPLVYPDMVRELAEGTDASGRVVRDPDTQDVLAKAQQLIDAGARCLVVALANSDLNPANERQVRRIIKQEYPRDYLGSVPVFLASDISPRAGAQARINTVILNAYVHAKLTRLLYKAGENLRARQYRKMLFIGHNNGTVARVAKTRAFQTYHSGPAAGLLGVQWIGELYGDERLISADMGGTSFDIGSVRGGEPGYALRPDVEGFECNLPMMEITAIGAGGGSLAHIAGGDLRVGPGSAGALPGPACFGLGGSEPTVTDANLALGILDPDFFLGGTMRLDLAKAQAVIDEKIASPLGMSVEQAALAIRAEVDRAMGGEVARVAATLGAGAPPTMVAYGGAGGLHACAIATVAGLEKIIIPRFAAVSSAFSSSLIDVGHIYYRRIERSLAELADLSPLTAAMADMEREARRDMRGEGFDFAATTRTAHVLVRDSASDQEVMIPMPAGAIENGALADLRDRAAAMLASGPRDMVLDTLGYRVRAQVPHYQPVAAPPAPNLAPPVAKGWRPVFLGAGDRPGKTPVYDRESLRPGHVIEGPAIIESDQTTILLDGSWSLAIDEYSNAIVEKG